MRAKSNPHSPQLARAFTLIELLALIAILILLAGVILPRMKTPRRDAREINCVNDQKIIGLSFRIYATDNDGRFPWSEYTNAAGTRVTPATNDLLALVLSLTNEFAHPQVLYCPADRKNSPATDMAKFTRANMSYFFGVNSSEHLPNSIVSGDANLTVGPQSNPIPRGIVRIPTDQATSMGIDLTRHRSQTNSIANFCFGDGSVRRLTPRDLATARAEAGTPDLLLNVP